MASLGVLLVGLGVMLIWAGVTDVLLWQELVTVLQGGSTDAPAVAQDGAGE